MNKKLSWVILHHSGGMGNDYYADTSGHTFKNVNDWHKTKWPGFPSEKGLFIGYNWLIEKDGQVFKGREEYEETAHTKGMNTSSVGICLTGNFSRLPGQANRLPTDEQIMALKPLLVRLVKDYSIPLSHIVGHHYFSQTDCPGKNIADDYWQKLIKPELNKEDPKEVKVELIKKQISIIEKIMVVLLKLQKILFGNRFGRSDN